MQNIIIKVLLFFIFFIRKVALPMTCFTFAIAIGSEDRNQIRSFRKRGETFNHRFGYTSSMKFISTNLAGYKSINNLDKLGSGTI